MPADKAKKYKKLTNAEKKMNKEITAKLRDEGIIPPAKPKLNRKKFAIEVNKEWDENIGYGDLLYLTEAIAWMNPGATPSLSISAEQIGVLKVLKLAIEIKKYKEEKTSKGETKYTLKEYYDNVISPILKL